MLVTLSGRWYVNSQYTELWTSNLWLLLLLTGCIPTLKPPHPTPPMPVHSELIAPLGGQREELCRAPTFLPYQKACFLPLDTSELEFDRLGHSYICCAFESSSSVRKVKNMSRRYLGWYNFFKFKIEIVLFFRYKITSHRRKLLK